MNHAAKFFYSRIILTFTSHAGRNLSRSNDEDNNRETRFITKRQETCYPKKGITRCTEKFPVIPFLPEGKCANSSLSNWHARLVVIGNRSVIRLSVPSDVCSFVVAKLSSGMWYRMSPLSLHEDERLRAPSIWASLVVHTCTYHFQVRANVTQIKRIKWTGQSSR